MDIIVNSQAAESCLQMGQEAFLAGDLNQAEEFYRRGMNFYSVLAGETGTFKDRLSEAVLCGYLGTVLLLKGSVNPAENLFKKKFEICCSLIQEDHNSAEAYSEYADVLKKCGDCARLKGEESKTFNCYMNSMFLYMFAAELAKTNASRYEYALACDNVAMYMDPDSESQVKKYYFEQELEILSAIDAEWEPLIVGETQSLAYRNLGELSQYQGYHEEAEEYFEKSLDILINLSEIYNTMEFKIKVGEAYEYFRDKAYGRKDYDEAAGWCMKCLDVYSALAERTRTVEVMEKLSDTYMYLGIIKLLSDEFSEAGEWTGKFLNINYELADRIPSPEAKYNAAFADRVAGDIFFSQCEMEKAKEHYCESAARYEKLLNEMPVYHERAVENLDHLYEAAGLILLCEDNLTEAVIFMRKFQEICLLEYKERGTRKAYLRLADSYSYLGCIAAKQELADEAQAQYMESIRIYQELLENESEYTDDAREKLCDIYMEMACIAQDQDNPEDAHIWKSKAQDLGGIPE